MRDRGRELHELHRHVRPGPDVHRGSVRLLEEHRLRGRHGVRQPVDVRDRERVLRRGRGSVHR